MPTQAEELRIDPTATPRQSRRGVAEPGTETCVSCAESRECTRAQAEQGTHDICGIMRVVVERTTSHPITSHPSQLNRMVTCVGVWPPQSLTIRSTSSPSTVVALSASPSSSAWIPVAVTHRQSMPLALAPAMSW
jgi:hypothetical protein